MSLDYNKNLLYYQDYNNWVFNRRALYVPSEKTERVEKCVAMIQYAVTYILGWTPETAVEHMTPGIMRQLRLDYLVTQYLSDDMDAGVILDEDIDYIMSYVFDLPFDRKKILLRMYDRIRRGEINRFSPNLFDGEEGQNRAAYLLGRFIAENFAFSSIADLYARFSDKGKIDRQLKAVNLYTASTRYQNPLEYFHLSLSQDERDDFLYNFYQYMNAFQALSTRKKPK